MSHHSWYSITGKNAAKSHRNRADVIQFTYTYETDAGFVHSSHYQRDGFDVDDNFTSILSNGIQIIFRITENTFVI